MKVFVAAVCLMTGLSLASCLVEMGKHRAGLKNVAQFFQKVKESQQLVLLNLK